MLFRVNEIIHEKPQGIYPVSSPSRKSNPFSLLMFKLNGVKERKEWFFLRLRK
jgi:hypothetical protein